MCIDGCALNLANTICDDPVVRVRRFPGQRHGSIAIGTGTAATSTNRKTFDIGQRHID